MIRHYFFEGREEGREKEIKRGEIETKEHTQGIYI